MLPVPPESQMESEAEQTQEQTTLASFDL